MSIYDDFLGVDYALESLLSKKDKSTQEEIDEPTTSKTVQSDPNSQEQLRLLKKRRRRNIPWASLGLALVTVSTAGFVFGVASPRFETKSKFLIKSADSSDNMASGFASLFSKNYAASQQDAKYLKLYLRSPGVIKQLDRDLGLSTAFSRPSVDFISRFKDSPTRESLSEFLSTKIRVEADDMSGAIELSTIAFDPVTSLQINKKLLSYSNDFIEKLNVKILDQELTSSREQMQRAEREMKNASEVLQRFRVETRTADSESERKLNSAYIKELKGEYAKASIEYAVSISKYADKNDPDLIELRDRMDSLEKLIAKEQSNQFDKRGSDSARRPIQESQLAGKLQLTGEIYKASVASYQKARIDASKKQKFLLYIDRPILSERQLKNWRWKAFGTVMLVAVGLYSLYAMVVTISKDRG
jgi:capsular polysaccharide transport system permease protein